MAAKLGLKFDPVLLKQAYLEFSEGKTWDSLGSEYSGLCEAHTRLPKMFFKKQELENINHVCEMNWEKASYQQLSLTRWDPNYSLEQRSELSGSVWDTRVAKRDPKADERWYRIPESDVPEYFLNVFDACGGNTVHRARFAKLQRNSRIKPHIDYDTTYGIRLHIPIITNEQCKFGGVDSDGGEFEFHMPADGSVWFINPGLKHWAVNSGDQDRIHLILSIDSHELIRDLK